MKKEEIQQMTDKELAERIEEEKELLVRQRLNHVVSPLDNPHKITKTKRLIARLKTEERQRAMGKNNEQ